MNIQIFGTKKCNDTKKAQRFFKERGIKFHFRDLAEKGVSQGELDNIKRAVDPDELIDKEGKQYKKRNFEYMKYNMEEELLEDPLLFKTPIVRNDHKVTLGNQPEVWIQWLSED